VSSATVARPSCREMDVISGGAMEPMRDDRCPEEQQMDDHADQYADNDDD